MKYFRYIKYVVCHKWFVFIGCLRLGWGNSFFWPLFYRGIIHDWSKFLPSEFFPYAEFFYGLNGEENSESAKDRYILERRNYRFNLAWLLHQKRNRHHWQFWILQNDTDGLEVLDMPDTYLLEMVADWYGAGRAINGREIVSPWYEANREKIILSERSRKTLETVIKNFDQRGG